MDSTSTLPTIYSQEEQNFLTKYLFDEIKIKSNVWLGAKRYDKNSFKWTDNSDTRYTNYAEKSPNRQRGDCLKMQSGLGFTSPLNPDIRRGSWADVSCSEKNFVLCQKIPVSLTSFLQKSLIEKEKNFEELIKQLTIETENSLKRLEQNLLPIGFVYVQFPDKKPPQEIWPSMTWNDISKQYENLFFRVLGNKTEAFGKIQEENISRISEVEALFNDDKGFNRNEGRSQVGVKCPNDGWSDWIYTGSRHNRSTYIRFLSSGGEVRPKNMAIKVWERTN